MKKSSLWLLYAAVSSVSLLSCNKADRSNSFGDTVSGEERSISVADSSSAVATLQIKDKQFIKSAEVNMEVKDVYDTTTFLEKSLRELGGFVISSNLNSDIVSEETFNTSDDHATLVRQYQTENTMKVRVPTEKLSDFLNIINDKKVFLHSRAVLAEDVTATIKTAAKEATRITKTGQKIDQLKADKGQVTMADANQATENQHEAIKFQLEDGLKFSNVIIFLKEPKMRIAEIAVSNNSYIENKYKFNFLYDLKNAAVDGFYLIQTIMVGLVHIWPLLLITGITLYFWRKIKGKKRTTDTKVTT